MTKEQSIEIAKDFTKMDFSNPMGWTGYYDTELKELQECIKTVLNMLKEKDKEIESIRYIKNSFDYVVQKESEKKDKIIDLMAKQLYVEGFCREFKCTKCNREPIQCIKQYFKSKAEKE